jgi:addiction module RelE/StbE family toxin
LEAYEVLLSPKALRDLDAIYAYVAQTFLEEGTAQALIDALETGIFSLEQLPYRCPERTVGAYANKGYRQLFIKNYTVIYRIEEVEKRVIVVTVVYSRRNV